jgi:hypothetical protein
MVSLTLALIGFSRLFEHWIWWRCSIAISDWEDRTFRHCVVALGRVSRICDYAKCGREIHVACMTRFSQP